MERTRAVSPPLSDESAPRGLASLEPSPKTLPLRDWVETVSSPGVVHDDVEALLGRLSGPFAEGEFPRERADQLLRLLQDEELGELTSRDGRQVRPAALEALLSLGYPYALEVPPEVLERMREPGARALSRSARWGLGLAAFAALLPSVLVASSTRDWWNSVDELAILGGVMLLPAALSALAERYRVGWLKYLGNLGLVLLSSGSLLLSWVILHGGAPKEAFTSLTIGLSLLGSAFCLRHRKDLED